MTITRTVDFSTNDFSRQWETTIGKQSIARVANAQVRTWITPPYQAMSATTMSYPDLSIYLYETPTVNQTGTALPGGLIDEVSIGR